MLILMFNLKSLISKILDYEFLSKGFELGSFFKINFSIILHNSKLTHLQQVHTNNRAITSKYTLIKR